MSIFTKYTITSEAHGVFTNCRRIQALLDIPEHNVKAGDFGGFIEGEYNLSSFGTCWIADDAVVKDSARVCDDAVVRDNVVLSDFVVVMKSAVVTGEARVSEHIWLVDRSHVCGTTEVSGHGLIAEDAVLNCDTPVHIHGYFGNEAYFVWFTTKRIVCGEQSYTE